MTDPWTLFNLVLAFFCGSILIFEGVRRLAEYLGKQDEINDQD